MNIHGRVFIVDDDADVRDALTVLLETAGYSVAAFSCAEDFLSLCIPNCAECPFVDKSSPIVPAAVNQCAGCMIVDVSMPGISGPMLQHELHQRGVQLPVIFLSGHGTIQTTVSTIKAGAIDFLTKPVKGSILLDRVKEALQQSAQIKKQSAEYRIVISRFASLTEREKEVMLLAVAGLTSKEIAQRLAISFRTVEIHRAHVMHKMEATNLLELARIVQIAQSQQN
ncbi:transcriptional regulatory protein TdiR [Sideroxyarcus emersonii]|uniref:Transcriptional regulatory protein TdiR n=1 Tax=Sideroxyarcus emersonii TaxID=2764705 RepID=A0AAN1X9X1_9PROT|nr:response regulator [Sideroxyarcus emersonii]BCK87257.1 transcriptional regulatory protein TdiR [Sideroxyarcus emersonii]